MPAYEQISKAMSKGSLAASISVGIRADFCHRGASAVTLRVQPGEAGIIQDIKNGQITEHRTQMFRVPIQANFALSTTDAEPVTLGDTLTWREKVYSVTDASMDPYKSVYLVSTIECKRLAEGIGR